MAQKTTLQPYGLPGQLRSFIAKSPVTPAPGVQTTPFLAGPGSYPIEIDSNRWAINDLIDSISGTDAGEIKAAPARVGSALYLTHVTIGIGTTTDVRVTLQDEDETNLYGPIQCQSDGSGFLKKTWNAPLKLTDNKALHYAAAGQSAAVLVYVEGFTGDKPLG